MCRDNIGTYDSYREFLRSVVDHKAFREYISFVNFMDLFQTLCLHMKSFFAFLVVLLVFKQL